MAFRRNTTDEERRKFDQFVHAITVIGEPHRMVHDGFMYHASIRHTGVLDAGVVDHLIVVPALTSPHMHRIRGSVGRGDVDIDIYEGSTASSDGTPIASLNTNRNSSNTPDTVINNAPTITGVGTLMHDLWIPPTATGVGQSAEGVSGASEGEEWLLAPSTSYLRRITNNSGSTIDMWFEYLWYEPDYEK